MATNRSPLGRLLGLYVVLLALTWLVLTVPAMAGLGVAGGAEVRAIAAVALIAAVLGTRQILRTTPPGEGRASASVAVRLLGFYVLVLAGYYLLLFAPGALGLSAPGGAEALILLVLAIVVAVVGTRRIRRRARAEGAGAGPRQ